LTEKEKWGDLYLNGTSNGATNMIINKKADFTIGKFAMTSLRNNYMAATFSYYSSPLIIVVPFGKPLTSLERLMKPFRRFLWILVLVVTVSAITFITFIKWKCNKAIQDFVLGTNNTSPYMNILAVFLGGSLAKLPGRNFARFLLAIFLLYCLVLRNSYTGALFTFIKSDNIHKPTLSSIDEMVDQNFTFYMIPASAQLTKEIPKVYNRRSIISAGQVPEFRMKMTDHSFKGGFLSSLEQIVYFNMINHKNFILKICPEQLYTFQYSLYFQKHSPFIHYFDLELLDYQANGLITNIVNKYVQFRFMKQENGQKAPKGLEIHQVMGILKVLIFGLTLAALVAGLECLSNSVLSLKKMFAVF
jgi:Ligand-gated ion channel